MQIGDQIDSKYTIVRDLGGGGMGHVYQVTDGKEEYALKICNQNDQESLKRFAREVRIMKTISNEHVINIIDDNLVNPPLYFTMPVCQYSLDKQIASLNGNVKQIMDFFIQGCKGVYAIHLSGAIHRDIKPSNMLLDQTDTIRVSDLGLGKFVNRESTPLTSESDSMGTLGYMPPEFFERRGTLDADQRSDIYQLGKTLYVLLTGRNPHVYDSAGLPGALDYIIRIATSRHAANRYQNVQELITAIEEYIKSLDTSKDPEKIFQDRVQYVKDLRYNMSKEDVRLLLPMLNEYHEQPDKFLRILRTIHFNLIKKVIASDPDLCISFTDLVMPVLTNFLENFRTEFEDADYITDTMRAIFEGSTDIKVRVEAIELTIMAASYKNRYYAMDNVIEMLERIVDIDEARAVAAMLRRNIQHYTLFYDKKQQSKVHYLIQEVKNEIRERVESGRRNQEGDIGLSGNVSSDY